MKLALEALFDGGRPYDVEYRAQRKNGEWFWHTIGLSPLATGMVVGLRRVFFPTLRRRKQAEETLVRLASIVEFSEDANHFGNNGRVITSWNRAAENMYGTRRRKRWGENLSFLVTPERQDEIRALLERVQTGNCSGVH